MPRNPRYDILFEPVRIGPVTAPNRFYQTPHATGMGYLKPESSATLRGIKAEGGWGVVCTEYCSIHSSSDDSPFAYLSLWDEDDVRVLAKITGAIHKHGSLAGVELWHGGLHVNNRMTREPILSPMETSAEYVYPGQVRAMDRTDIKDLRRWQVEAAVRAERAGADIVYVYAGHGYLPFQFISPLTNQRTDEYGGSLENRVRLLREMIEETKDAVGARCAVAVRLAVDELHGPGGVTWDKEGREVIAMLAELPDLWDVNLAGSLGNDSTSARFSEEGYQESYVAFVKHLTTKPVVSVGRFTSPDRMVSQIKRGIQDFIGAARPSIADPFLPIKIKEGREDEIRECIGCNICRAANNEAVPLRCTQNPTIGEEWRRGWHPERIQAKSSDARILIVGAGPAGLECARALGQRGYHVILAEKSHELGGRVLRESSLPGLSTWRRVRDYRALLIEKMPHVEIYLESSMTPNDIHDAEVDHVVIATGSHWRRDAIGARRTLPIDLAARDAILTPDDVFAGAPVGDHVVIYDDEHYFMGSTLAEKLRKSGHRVTLVTTLPIVSSWTQMTDEQYFVQKGLMEMGVELVLSHGLAGVEDRSAILACAYSGRERQASFDTLILVTGRHPNDALYHELNADMARLEAAGIKSVTRIGDCLVPSSIADAVYRGHKYAREFEMPASNTPVPRERPLV